MLERAIELAERGRGTTHPNPVVGAVVVRDGEVVGEGWHERKGGPHAEVVALDAAGEAARGATLYVTLEPCDHHGSQPPCVDAVVAAGIANVVVGAKDPTRDGIARLREAGVEVDLVDSREARVQNEAWLTWARLGRPFVTYKAAVTLDGRMTLPGERWISGEESRRLVHELRAASDAVAVGMGTVRADDPRLDAREVDVSRQPRRLAFGTGPLPAGSELELLDGELGGGARPPRRRGRAVASARGRRDAGRRLLPGRSRRQAAAVRGAEAERRGTGPCRGAARAGDPDAFERPAVGQDVLLTAYVHEP